MPKEWTEDAACCRAAGVPEEVAFQPNWRLALDLIDQMLAWGLEKPPLGAGRLGLWRCWVVEEYHKALKTGCAVEQRQRQSA